jgi:hypothetical protein
MSRVQPHWTSAYDGYGTSSLDIDVAEIGALVDHIRKEDGESFNKPSSLRAKSRNQESGNHGPFNRIPRCHPLPHFPIRPYFPPTSRGGDHASSSF